VSPDPVADPLSRLTAALEGRYRIQRELGQGGMATVYLAQDLRHDRKVALKVLRPELSAILGANRFLAEIKTTANLQHPHILSLFDSGEANGLVYYVMPFVEGESLRDRLNREHQLPVEEAVRIAREVADALGYAHAAGIIHRDIKPENILLHGGHAMVADFGIALAASRTEGGSRMTETGMSLGTPFYMAPEQAMGEREITAKADIYALGCVLYEMLTAEPPFTGATPQAIVARVMTEEPRPLTMQRRTIPPHVEAAVMTALSKLPADRFASAKEFSAALGNTSFVTTTTMRTAPMAVRTPRAQALAILPWALAAVTLVLFGWERFRSRPAPPSPPVTRFSIQYIGDGRISDAAGSPIAVSPDGSRIVYVGTDSARTPWLYSRVLERNDPVQIAGTRGANNPFFSPDGASIGFTQDGRLKKLGLGGGAVVTICEPCTGAGSWVRGDTIYFANTVGLHRVAAAGGQPELVLAADTAKAESLRWVDALPDGRNVLVTVVRQGTPGLAVISLPDAKLHDLGQAGMYPRWVEAGFLTFLQQDGTLFAVPFDAENRKITGAPVPITDGVRFGPAFPGKMGVARTGTMAFIEGGNSLRQLVLADVSGRVTVLPGPSRFYDLPRFSPEGQRIAVQVTDFAGVTTNDIWLYDLRSEQMSRLTFDSSSAVPAWTPDGRHLVYVGRGRTVLRIPTDGSGVPETLTVRQSSPGELELARDGKTFAFRQTTAATTRDVWFGSLDSSWAERPLLRTPFNERSIALSPDGKWLAYVSNEAGSDELFVRRLEEGGGRWRVPRGGAGEPRWGPGGRELFFRVADTVMAMAMTPGPEPGFSAARTVLVGRFISETFRTVWDISPDGRRFVFTRNQGDVDTPAMTVLLHWFDRLRAGKAGSR
jgi:Tol biopolymer transport system component/tRNA A-37 threonylcarbamoyl transferase component Bud32